MTIIMGDVNGLKLINDSFGHAVGDELLIKIGKILKKSFRADDIIARVGGDEYAILLPRTDGIEARELINRVMRTCKKEKIRDLDVSISVGLATKTDMSESTDQIIKMAEDFMYNNKLFEGPSVRGKMIDNIVATINEKSTKEQAHLENVSKLCGAIADAYDAMTNERSYRPAMTHNFAVEELKKNSGTQFDPELISVFLEKVLPKLNHL